MPDVARGRAAAAQRQASLTTPRSGWDALGIYPGTAPALAPKPVRLRAPVATRSVGTASSGLVHEPALDGLRGVAVALVLAFHAGWAGLPGGFLGVSVFFTLSGFLITRLLLAEHDRQGRIDLLAFWGRRFRRLLPAALLCVAGVLVFGATVATTGQRLALPGDVIGALLDFENWHFILGGVGYATVVAAPSPLQHFWSLAIEEQFYLLFPPVLVVLLGRRSAVGRRDRRRQRKRLLWALGVGIALSTASAAWLFRPDGSPLRAYYGTGVRAAELLVGCLLAVAMHWRGPVQVRALRRALAVGSFLSVAVLAWAWSTQHVNSSLLYRGGLVAHAVLVGVLIFVAVQPASPLKAVLGTPPLAALGRISYGVYLFHWPIFLWLDPAHTSAPAWAVQAARLLLTVAVAVLSYRVLELPIRRRRTGSNRVLALAFPVVAVLLGLGAVGLTLNVAPARGNTVEVSLRDSVRRAPVHVSASQGPPPSPLGRPVRLMAAGDSLAYQVFYAFAPWISVFPGRIELTANTAAPGCGLIERGQLNERDDQVSGHNPACRTITDRNAVGLAVAHPDVVLVVTGVWDTANHRLPGDAQFRGPGDPTYDRELLTEYQQRIDQWRAGGAAVVWAEWPCIAPTRVADGGALPSGFDAGRMRYLKEVILPRLAQANPDVRFVDLSRDLCPGGVLEAQDQAGHQLRTDDGLHLASDGGALARDQLIPEVMAAAASRPSAAPPSTGP